MAWVQSRNGRWRVLFRHAGRCHSFWLGEVTRREAEATAAQADYWLMRLEQGLVALPPGCDLATFVRHDGRPPARPAGPAADLTLAALRDAYLAAMRGKLEDTTLDAAALHFAHLARLLGADARLAALAPADLQRYVDARAGEWIDPNVHRARRRERDAARPPRGNRKPPPPAAADRPRRHPSAATVRKELVTLRRAWNWARGQLALAADYPGRRLAYPKTDERPPYLTWEEAERRVAAGADPARVWECVYLRPAEVAELLEWVKGRPVSPWVYPMFCFAAYTGARRSEVVRATPADLDLAGWAVTIREKKRDRRRNTTRRVPLTPALRAALADWAGRRAGGPTLFCKGTGAAVTPREAQNYFRRALRTSKWRVLKGWHVFRHSFISALASKGVDQRVIDDLVGHATEEQRRRYRHLYPDVTRDAVAAAFDAPGR